MRPKLYVYSKQGCGFCDKLTEFLDKKSFPYEKFDLNSDYTTDQFLCQFGRGATFPQVCVEGRNIGGMKDTIRYLHEQNLI